ncbi:MAG: hypothetical protein WKF73_15440 [Nocardioidaceae bacterium]
MPLRSSMVYCVGLSAVDALGESVVGQLVVVVERQQRLEGADQARLVGLGDDVLAVEDVLRPATGDAEPEVAAALRGPRRRRRRRRWRTAATAAPPARRAWPLRPRPRRAGAARPGSPATCQSDSRFRSKLSAAG